MIIVPQATFLSFLLEVVDALALGVLDRPKCILCLTPNFTVFTVHQKVEAGFFAPHQYYRSPIRLLEFEALPDRIAIVGLFFEVVAAAGLVFDVGELAHDVFRAREGMLWLFEGWDARNRNPV